MARLASIFAAIAFAIAGVNAVTTGTCYNVKKTSSNPNGQQSYDVSKYYCFQGEGVENRDLLCPKNPNGYTTYACSGSCYAPTDYVCINGALVAQKNYKGQLATCPGAQSNPFDPEKYHCYAGGLLCPFYTERCAGGCYDPHDYSCPNGVISPIPEDPKNRRFAA
ncbi:hypothetical protein NA57DRAFT_51532 [Rhizodiscina lignyota]|uniref:Endo-1,3(4)-beta-glucanase 1 carbohydrate binding domain-containing protein n=1 Tax=Rhizodiscina lignyota TaxID=1504668 RepID=A0A9P4MBJ7_9PEZI|nr:hypothetical protein NA57DRAFT_51532 [Rhizodiscina lignyota]